MFCTLIHSSTTLMHFVHYIHGRTALIFRTLCPWLYEVFATKSQNHKFRQFEEMNQNGPGFQQRCSLMQLQIEIPWKHQSNKSD